MCCVCVHVSFQDATLTSSSVLTVTALTWPGTAMATTTAWTMRTATRRTAPLLPPWSAVLTSTSELHATFIRSHYIIFSICRCSNNLCIQKAWTCDGEPDCLVTDENGVSEDESPALCGGQDVAPTCPEYQCSNGQCTLNV